MNHNADAALAGHPQLFDDEFKESAGLITVPINGTPAALAFAALQSATATLEALPEAEKFDSDIFTKAQNLLLILEMLLDV